MMKHVVIVGGGFAGVYAARGLLKRRDVKVTLISKRNYFLFIPMLHEVATGGLSGYNLAEPYRGILRGKNFSFLQDEVREVDLVKRHVACAHGEVPYDYLVLATGSTTNFFGTKGAEEHCFVLKSLEDAFRLKNQVVRKAEEAFMAKEKDVQEQKLSVVIVGAGPTGVELAIEMQELLEQICKSNASFHGRPSVYLIQRGDRVIPQIPRLQGDAERQLKKHGVHVLTGAGVTEVRKDGVVLQDGRIIAADTVVWSAGVKPSIVKTIPDVAGEKRCLVVDAYLRLLQFPEVFVIGDCATYIPEGEKTPIPMLAQVATEQGKSVGKNLARLLGKRELVPFSFKLKGQFISLGKGYGAGFIGPLKLTGFKAWWLNRTIYLFKILGAGNKLKTAWEWTLNLFTKRDACEH